MFSTLISLYRAYIPHPAVTSIPRTRCSVACIAFFKTIEAVQQFKIEQKECANRGFKFTKKDNLEVKYNCGTAYKL